MYIAIKMGNSTRPGSTHHRLIIVKTPASVPGRASSNR